MIIHAILLILRNLRSQNAFDGFALRNSFSSEENPVFLNNVHLDFQSQEHEFPFEQGFFSLCVMSSSEAPECTECGEQKLEVKTWVLVILTLRI